MSELEKQSRVDAMEQLDSFDFRPLTSMDIFSYESPPRKEYSSSPSPPLSSVSSEDFGAFFDTPCRATSPPSHPASFNLISQVSEHIGEFIVFQADRNHAVTAPTAFDSPNDSPISLPAYIDRIMQISHVMPETLVCATALVRRVIAKSGIAITHKNMYRLIAASVRVCAKFYDDELDDRKFWKQIVGLHRYEVNNLEAEILNLCDFRLRITPEEFHDVVVMVSAFHKAHDHEHSRADTSSVDGRDPLPTLHRTTSDFADSMSVKGHARKFTVPLFSKLHPHRHIHVRFSLDSTPPLNCQHPPANRPAVLGIFKMPRPLSQDMVKDRSRPSNMKKSSSHHGDTNGLRRTLSVQHISGMVHSLRVFGHHHSSGTGSVVTPS